MGFCFSKPNEEEEWEKDYINIPQPNEYKGKRNWKNQRHGYGTYFYDNGDVYEGEWAEDEKHGSGTYNFASGKVYVIIRIVSIFNPKHLFCKYLTKCVCQLVYCFLKEYSSIY